VNKKKNLLVDGGCDCRASDISFASDAKRVLRGRGRAMESVRACAVSWVRSFNSFIFYENLKVCQVSVLKCFTKIITFQLLLKYHIQMDYIIARHFNILVEILDPI